MGEAVPGTLGDYLTEHDLVTLPVRRDTRLVLPHDAAQIFASLKAAEQRALALRAVHWAIYAGASVPELSRALLALLAREMRCPR